MPADRPKPPHPGDLIKTIRSLVGQGKLRFTGHAGARMDERGIRPGDVQRVLRQGDIDGDITSGRNATEWRCLVVGRLDWTPREAGVATIIVRKDYLIIVTVEWMDL
jgi:hypothetical protein